MAERWEFTIPAGAAIDESSNFATDVTFRAAVDVDAPHDLILAALDRGARITAKRLEDS